MCRNCGAKAEWKVNGIDLCDKCKSLPQTRCKHCATVVKVGEKNIAAHQPYGPPSNMALCETCEKLPQVTCAHCPRVLSVGGENVAWHQPYGKSPDTNALCETCDKLTPQVKCARCNKVVSVADEIVANHQPHGKSPDTNALCEACEKLTPQVKCAHCNKVVSVAGETVLTHQPHGNSSGANALCGACDKLTPQVKCAYCAKVVSVRDKNVAQHRPYGKSPDTNALCETCDKLTPKNQCTLCSKLLRVDKTNVEKSTSYADDAVMLCPKCSPKISVMCRACGIPAAYKNLTGKDESLPGGLFIHKAEDESSIVGWRCPVCAVDPLKTTTSAENAYKEVVEWMTGWVKDCGETYPVYGERLKWSIERDGTFKMDDKERELGHCITVDDIPKQHQIHVLFYMRPISFQQTMAHELTHALTNELGCDKKAIIEGFCNYVAYLFLLHKVKTGDKDQQAEANRAIDRMLKNTDKLYGLDFLAVREALETKPKTALTWLADS